MSSRKKDTKAPAEPVAAVIPAGDFDLSKRAVLVAFNVTRPRLNTVDKGITQATRASHGITEKKTISTVKSLFGDELKPIESAISDLRDNVHYRYTVKYEVKGQGLLVSGLSMEYAKLMRDGIEKINKLIDSIMADYDGILARRRAALNGAFNEGDYPTKAEIQNAYSVSFTVTPLPSVNQFSEIIGMANEDKALAMAELTTRLQDAANVAMLDVWQRLYEQLQHVASTLKDGKCGKVYDSLLGNIVDLCRILPALNVVGDNNLTRMTQKIEAEILGKHSTESLKQNEEGQKDAAAKADAIMKIMSGYMGLYQ